jgi:hypothetical protein
MIEIESASLEDDSWSWSSCMSAVSATCSKVATFVADHKTEIFVGAALAATGAAAAAALGYTLSASFGGVIVAGAGSIFSKEDPPKFVPPKGSPPTSGELAQLNQAQKSIPRLDLPPSPNDTYFASNGVWVNGQFFSNEDLAKQPGFLKEPICTEPQLAKKEEPIRDGFNQHPKSSTPFTIPGRQDSDICWTNGISNTFEDSKNSARYIQSLAGGSEVSGVYNCTHSLLIDVLEAGVLNHPGYSPNTAPMLEGKWRQFLEANKHRPNARLLQVCHSQGAIHVRNALEHAPPEIRDRVIVVAIAPAAVVPKELCFNSFNYVSKKDSVYQMEPAPLTSKNFTFDEVLIPSGKEEIVHPHRDELIILEPHPDATGMDHEFQSPTYREHLKKTIATYKLYEGEFRPDQKERIR